MTSFTGPSGGSCTQSGTPCYSALQPYLESYQECADEFAYYSHQFALEDAKAGTGLTADQLSTLSYYKNCMAQASQNIAKVARQYVPENVLFDVLETLSLGVVAAALLKYGASGASQLIQTFRTKPVNGSSAADAMVNAEVQADVDNGSITAEAAPGFLSSVQEVTQSNIQDSTEELDQLVLQDVISQSTADAVAEALAEEMTEDEDSVASSLESLL